MSWAEIDAWKRQRLQDSMREGERVQRIRDQVKRPVVYHLAREERCYRVVMYNGELRSTYPRYVRRYGVATRSRMVLLAACGEVRCRGGEADHRPTVKRKRIKCPGCLVWLDAELEAGRAYIGDGGTVFLRAATAP